MVREGASRPRCFNSRPRHPQFCGQLSHLTHSVEDRDGYLKVTLTPEHANLPNLTALDDLLRRYGFEAIDEPAPR